MVRALCCKPPRFAAAMYVPGATCPEAKIISRSFTILEKPVRGRG